MRPKGRALPIAALTVFLLVAAPASAAPKWLAAVDLSAPGKSARRLDAKGQVGLRVQIAFTPDGGPAVLAEQKLTLFKNLR